MAAGAQRILRVAPGGFNTGLRTVTPRLRLVVSGRLRDDFRNGHSYYPHHDAVVRVPDEPAHRPERQFLEWHNQFVFRS
jgi:putative restriction endonuclease